MRTAAFDVTKIFASLKKGVVDGMVVISPKLITNFPALILRLSLERQIPLASLNSSAGLSSALSSKREMLEASERIRPSSLGAERYV